jgi:hypothetical protein
MNLLEIKNLKMDFGKNAEALRGIDDMARQTRRIISPRRA